MTRNKKVFLRAAALLLMVCLCVTAVACVPREGTEQPSDSTQGIEKVTYTILVGSEGGLPLAGIGVYIYTDSTLQELVWFAKTDDAGRLTFTDVPGDSYVAVLADVPEGYAPEETYPLTGETTEIILAGGEGEGDLANITYQLGDVMLDFTVTAPDGTAYTLSQLLENKKAVVLNFWYIQCNPCKAEFPYMQEAYTEYREDIEILAINPVNLDDAAIAQFQSELELTFPMAQGDPNWEKAMDLTAYPTTVVVDRYGTISMIHEGSITEAETFERIFSFFTDEEYEQTVVEDIEELPELEKPGSNPDDPIELGSVTSFQVTVEPGQMMYYHLYRVNDMYLSISNASAYAVYNNRTYNPTNGRVGFMLSTPDTYTPASVAFGNSGKETVTYTVNLSPAAGTVNNPYTLKLGEFSTSMYAGNDQGVYYSFTATEEGLFTVRCLSVTNGVRYDYSLYNLSSYAMRTLESDGATDADGNESVSINVKPGQVVQVIVSTLPDSTNTYPSANFVSLASFTAGATEDDVEDVELINYAISVTDENRTPVAGVYLYVDVEGKPTAIVTDEQGVAKTKLEKGSYKVTLAVPGGYSAYTTEYQLTEARPTFSIKLDTLVVETETYTVKAVDENGAPVAGVLVTIGSGFGYTDENGSISLVLEKGTHTAVIGAPDGYTSDSASYTFEEGVTELTVTLKSGSSEEPDDTKTAYSVTVADYFGAPVTGVTVQFLSDGVPVAVKTVDENGVAAVNLVPGCYSVLLAFSGETMYYDEAAAVLTEAQTTVTITLIGGVTGEKEDLYVGTAYYVNVGGTYAALQADVTNYFLFAPTESGVYRFTTSDPAAVISYWGGSTVGLIIDQTGGLDDYANNAFTLNVKPSNIGATYILGVTGASECVLEITRIGDAVLGEADIVPDVWTGEDTPTAAYKVTDASGKTLTYLDLTAQTDAYKLVYNPIDGYYHLNTLNGPVLYVNLGPDARYLSMYNMLGFSGYGGTGLTQTFYDENGNAVRREDYTACMEQYVTCMDATYGVYPLNDDLIYMIQQGGQYKGWWDSTNGNYLFTELEGLNPELGWMFAVCYFE